MKSIEDYITEDIILEKTLLNHLLYHVDIQVNIVNPLSYLNESFYGNLLSLWKPLESIKEGVKENDVSVINIPNKELDGFINMWAKERHNCDLEVCGKTCNYCKAFYERISK